MLKYFYFLEKSSGQIYSFPPLHLRPVSRRYSRKEIQIRFLKKHSLHAGKREQILPNRNAIGFSYFVSQRGRHAAFRMQRAFYDLFFFFQKSFPGAGRQTDTPRQMVGFLSRFPMLTWFSCQIPHLTNVSQYVLSFETIIPPRFQTTTPEEKGLGPSNSIPYHLDIFLIHDSFLLTCLYYTTYNKEIQCSFSSLFHFRPINHTSTKKFSPIELFFKEI